MVKTFGQKIKELRKERKLTLLEVSDLIGISEGYLSRIENDKQIPSTLILIRLCTFYQELGIDCDKYLTFSLMKMEFGEEYFNEITTRQIKGIVDKNA